MKVAILVSGWSAPGFEWKASPIVTELTLCGYDVVRFKQCNYGWGDIAHNGKKLARLVESLKYTNNYSEIVIIGHSLGGLIARYADMHITMKWPVPSVPSIDAIVTLGTPHYGVRYGRAAFFSKSAKQMDCDSRFLKMLNANHRQHSSRYYCVGAKYDQLVPHSSAIWDRAEHNETFKTEHLGLIFDKKIAKSITEFFYNEK